jgi:AraC family transcriptional regulator of arabinose operon
MDARIAFAILRMEQHLDGPLTLQDLAASVQLSASRFAHLFREETGLPPKRFCHKLRMERARLLLEDSSLSVRQVMYQVGFRDPSHFSRDFRRFHGAAPSELRRTA